MDTAPIAVAVSGGVDSLYALWSLHMQGRRVIAVHGRFLPLAHGAADPVPRLDALCRAWGIAFHCVDCVADFDREVIDPFVRSYARGGTPNPCALCNAAIKFGLLLDKAREYGATRIATGHYARVEQTAQGVRLCQAADAHKDQSYFLALVPRERLAAAYFPMARVLKTDAVRILQEQGVRVPLPGESQEICFVPQDAYRPFLQAQCATRGVTLGGAGAALLHAGTASERTLGQHKGLWQYTEGQRRGLGIAHSEPLYVQGKDMARNALLLCTKEALGMGACTVERLNMLVPQEAWPQEIFARVRYKQQPAPAHVSPLPPRDGLPRLRITFEQGQNPTAPGQVAALYDADGCVLAGGIITETQSAHTVTGR